MQWGRGGPKAIRALAPRAVSTPGDGVERGYQTRGALSAPFTFWGASTYPALGRRGTTCLLTTGSYLYIQVQGVRDRLSPSWAEHLKASTRARCTKVRGATRSHLLVCPRPAHVGIPRREVRAGGLRILERQAETQ